MAELSPSLEDYLETIYLLKRDKNIVKSIEIAKRLKVKKPSVTGAVKKLSEKGFLKYKKYNKIIITKKGERIAKSTYKKHILLSKFFIDVLKINKNLAEKEACNVEHTLSDQTLNKLTKFVETLK